MRATEFEFRYRFYIISLLFFGGFFCYTFDHVNAAEGLAKAIWGPGLDLDLVRGRHELQALFLAGALLTVAAAALRTWASAYLQSDIVHSADLHTEGLVADGPFRYVRNPLYLGTFLLAAGMGVIASRTGCLVLMAGMLFFVRRLIGREEAELVAAQGQRYRAFQAAVPRLWPAPRPRVPAGGIEPRWLQAWVGEVSMWCFAAGVLGFALTLNLRVLWALIALAFVGYGANFLGGRRGA